MTNRDEKKVVLRRSDLRAARAGAAVAANPKSRTKQVLLTTFGVLAAAGFVAAYLIPTSVALADAPAADQQSSSAWAQSVDGAQSFEVAADATTNDVERSSFELYLTPTPTPTPTQEPSTSFSDSSGEDTSVYVAPSYTGGGTSSDWMTAAGIPSSDWAYVDYIVSHESGWNPNATNASSGACGLVQALPCSKVPGGGYDPVANLQWASGYAIDRYGSWAGAYNFWIANSWW